MLSYIVSKCVHLIVTLLLTLALVFLAIRLAPGDPVTDALSRGSGSADTALIERIKQENGLNDPIPVQLGRYIWGLITRGDLGRSWANYTPVSQNIAYAWPYTFRLAVAATLVSVVFGVVLGIISAARQDSWIDNLAGLAALSGVSMPVFFTALFFMYVFGFQLAWFPISGADNWDSLVLPAASLGVILAAAIARFTRAAMIDVIREDYVRTARSKGLREGVVLYRHAFRNAVIPVLTVIGLQFGLAMCGAVVTETVFSWPGLGQVMVNSIILRDYDMVQGAAMVFAASVGVVNLVIDVLYAVLDPRIEV